jgi:outer membrane receptor protein involved in Fe transport
VQTRDLRRVFIGVLAAGTLFSSSASAQIGSASLTGIVRDQSGQLVPGALVTVTHVGAGRSRETTTNADGVYSLPTLSPGQYRVQITLAGFKPAVHDAVALLTGDTRRLDVTLYVSSVAETVTIVDEVPVLREERASLGTVIDNDQVEHLPLNGRTFITLAGLAPGVALPPNSQLPRINGGRPRTNEYLFDGISVLQPEPGQVAYFPVIDSIQEFKVESNSPPAEFGRFNGGVVNLTTKSGSNSVHGTVFDFVRNEALNARNFFQSTTPVKPAYRRNQFGGTAGGPIVKSRTFFFGDYQGQRQSIARTVISTVPTALQRQGIFTEAISGRAPLIYDPATGTSRTQFPNNTIPASRMDPVAVALLERYPLPTSAGTANNYRRTDSEVDDQNQWSMRIDHHAGNGRDHIFGRLAGFRGTFLPVTPLPDGSGVTTGTLGPQDTQAWSFASNYQHVFSSSLLNDLRIGDTRRAVQRAAAQLNGMSLSGIPASASFSSTLPTFLISGYQQLGSPPNTASDFSTGVIEVADSVTWLKGRHTIKAGFDFRWERLDVVQPPSPTGSYTFTSLFTDLPGVANTGAPFASFLLGQVQTFSIDVQRHQIQERAHFQEYYVQDDWKISDKLTVNPGLRYTLNFPSTEINGQTGVFNLQRQQLEYPGTEPVRTLKKNNFGPRLGAVYRASDRTVASAGYGLVWIEMAGITTPFTTPTFPFLQTVSQRTLDNLTPAFVLRNGPSAAPLEPTPTAGLGQGVFSVDADLGSGYVQQWNASIQRAVTSSIVAEVSYLGSTITHVGIPDTNLNQLSVDELALGTALTQRVANPYYGSIPQSSSLGDPTITVAQLLKPYPQYTTVSLYRNNVGTTSYQGLALSLRQRSTNGLAWSAAYTRSRLKDDASSVFDASILTGPVANYPVADSFDRSRERDYSTGDIPHVFAGSVVWDLPFGQGRARALDGWLGVVVNDWSVASVITLQSGVPVAITQTTNFNAFAGFGVQRPNLVGDPELPSDQRTVARWFNTDAFSIAPQFTLGSASRNPIRGPGFNQVDLSLSRRVPVAGRAAMEFRAEIFNLFNTPNFGAPAAVAGTPAFGTITSALDPRVVQVAAKLLF